MNGKHSKQTEAPSTPPVTDTQADTTPAETGHHMANTEPQTPPVHPVSNYNTPTQGNTVGLGRCTDVIGKIAQQTLLPLSLKERLNYAATSRIHRNAIYGHPEEREKKITSLLLQAVAYGMESKGTNRLVKLRDAGHLFKTHLFAEDLLKHSPEFLLGRAHLTDWAGRTFKGRITAEHPEGEGITAFQYAVWAKDFKMMEMMVKCLHQAKISEEERERIQTELFRQGEQVTALRSQGGGLTYIHTYERPKMNARGIPQKDASGNWDCETVTFERYENHFDLTPLIEAYEDYKKNFGNRNWSERDACWVKVIGAAQGLLPVHILQRYNAPNTPFHPIDRDKTFYGEFIRSASFHNVATDEIESLFSCPPGSDFALMRNVLLWSQTAQFYILWDDVSNDLVAIRRLDEVSTNEIEKIIQQLSQPLHSTGPRP